MELRNDEMIIWKEKAHMLVNGPAAAGEFVITNKRMAFFADSETTILRRSTRSTLWDIAIGRVQDIDLRDLKGLDHPVIRIHYAENDLFFTFPESAPKTSLAAIRLFVNSARRIEKEMDLMRGVSRSLKDDRLHLHGKLPDLIKDIPLPADQVCFQCGKELQEAAIVDPDDISECTVCDISIPR